MTEAFDARAAAHAGLEHHKYCLYGFLPQLSSKGNLVARSLGSKGVS